MTLHIVLKQEDRPMIKKLIFLSLTVMLFLSTTTTLGAEPKSMEQFVDVTENHAWAHEAISALCEEGILNGIDEDFYF